MVKWILLVILYPILGSSCNKEDAKNLDTDITQYSWKVKSISINGTKSTTPIKNYHGEEILDKLAYNLIFKDDSNYYLDLSINKGQGKYQLIDTGQIVIDSYGTTYICCNNDFDNNLLSIITSVTSYEVIGNTLFIKGKGTEIELIKGITK